MPAVPVALLGLGRRHHQLGANPVNFAILTTGMSALVFLLLTLLVTPLRKISGWNWIIFFRRTLGLYAFFYACAALPDLLLPRPLSSAFPARSRKWSSANTCSWASPD